MQENIFSRLYNSVKNTFIEIDNSIDYIFFN